MLKKFINYHSCRSISKSSIYRNLEKSKLNENDSSPTSPTSTKSTLQDLRLEFAPTKTQKKLLVWSGKYKSEKDIPPRMSYESYSNARTNLRIRISNLLMVMSLLAFGYYVWLGKKKQREGDSIYKIMQRRNEEILSRAEAEKKGNK